MKCHMFCSGGRGQLSSEEFQRFVILNRLASRSVSRAPGAFPPPLIEGHEAFLMLAERQESGGAIEYFGADEAGRDAEEERCRQD